MRHLITIALLMATLPATAQMQFVHVEQCVTNAYGDFNTNGLKPVLVVELVADIAEASNVIAEVTSDPDFFGVKPPDEELAYDANLEIKRHADPTYWPYPTQPCSLILIDQHRSKKTGLAYYVEFDCDDGRFPTPLYRLKCEKESDVKKLKDKCELRQGKTLKVKDKKLKP